MKTQLNYYFNFDIYSKTPNFYFQNHDRVNTCFGTFLTILYVIISLSLFIYQTIVILNRKNLKVYDSTKFCQEMPFIELDSNTLYFAFGLEDPQTNNRFIDNSIYIPKIVFVNKEKINDELVTVYQKTMDIEKCNVLNFGEDYQHLFHEDELNNSYCLKKFDNLTLAGGYRYERFSYIRIRIYPCVNSSTNNFSCKSQEEIDRFMSSGYFSIIIKDIGLNPSNYSFPTLPILQNLYTTIDKQIYKNYIFNLGVTEIDTDTGLFNDNIETKKYLQFRKDSETFIFRDEEEYYNGKSVIMVQFKLDDNIFVQNRSYMKISEIFSLMGGYMQLINTIFILISLIVNKFTLEIKILNNIFKFNLKKKKLIMKYQKLNDAEVTNANASFSQQRKSQIINIKKSTNIIKNNESDNKSKISLIKENPINNFSLINAKDNNNESEIKSKITMLRPPRRSNAIAFENLRFDQPKARQAKRSFLISQEKSKENGTLFDLNNSQNYSFGINYKEYNDHINLDIIDYCCCNLIRKNREKNIYLFNISNSFFRKKLDVVNVFNLLLLIEKNILKKNFEFIHTIDEEN